MGIWLGWFRELHGVNCTWKNCADNWNLLHFNAVYSMNGVNHCCQQSVISLRNLI